MPVPPELGLRCQGCGEDLSGLEERTCPKCDAAFHLPVPEELGLRCQECGYALTGLTTRTCPECGTGFDVSGLLFAQRVGRRRYRLLDRLPWHDALEALLALVLIGFGILVVKSAGAMVAFYVGVLASIAVLVMGYNHGLSVTRIILVIGATWTVLGGLTVLGG